MGGSFRLAAGSEWIETLVGQALDGLGRTPGLPVGSELPPELEELVDHETVVLFWNPGCGFCQAMHEDLLGWEASPPDGAPGLVFVSSGEGEEVRDAFRSPVVLDPDWALSSRLGAEGTPMAVLVGADRRIASPLVTGGEAILRLLGAEVAAAA